MRKVCLAPYGWLVGILGVCGMHTGWAEPPPAEAPVVDDPFAYAPEGEWPMEDGCPARTRATRTRLLTGALEVAWTFEPLGTIHGDPIVSGDWVYLATAGKTHDDSCLEVLRLSDGVPVVPRHILPGVIYAQIGARGDSVVVTTDGEHMELVRVDPVAKALVPVAHLQGLGAPVIAGNLVVSSTLGSVDCADMLSGALRWHGRPRGEVLGPPTVRDGWVRVVTSREEKGFVGTRSYVESFALDTGAPGPAVAIGWDSEKNEAVLGSSIVAARDEIFILHRRGFRVTGGGDGLGARMALSNGLPEKPFFLDSPDHPVVWGAQTLLRCRGDDGARVLVASEPRKYPEEFAQGGWRWAPLANPKDHAELLADGPQPVIAAGVATYPGGSFVVGSRRVVELRAHPLRTVRIPVRETVLEDDGRRLTAWRRAKSAVLAEAGPRLPRSSEAKPVEILGGAAVLRDGSVRAGNLTYSPAEGVLGGLAKEKVKYDDLALVVDRDGKIVHGPDPALAARRLPAAAAARVRGEWLARARKAVATRSAPTLREAIDDLAARGGRAEDVAPLRKELDKLENPRGAPPKPDAGKIAEIERLRAPLLALEESSLSVAVAGLPDDTPIVYRSPLLRALLARSPNDPAAIAWLRSKLPAGFDPGSEVAPLDWLDLIEATSQTPISILARKEGGPMTMDERVYASLRTTWRKDLVALRSDRLLLVTPVGRPSRIARCLSLGELACTALDTMFELTGDQLRTIDPLSIQLFETKDEYVKRSDVGDDEEERQFIDWTAGTYDPSNGLARLYVPPGDDRFDGVLETLAHELAHAWLDQRMPPPAGAARRGQKADTANYFLEEGMATMVEELRYDVDARTFLTQNPMANSLDIVAGSPSLLDWDVVVEGSAKDYRRISRDPEFTVPFRWVLGRRRESSRLNLYYAQSAAICHYLWDAEGGKHRAALREWVRDMHADRVAAGETQRRLGMSAQQLGAAVAAWAKEVSSPTK